MGDLYVFPALNRLRWIHAQSVDNFCCLAAIKLNRQAGAVGI